MGWNVVVGAKVDPVCDDGLLGFVGVGTATGGLLGAGAAIGLRGTGTATGFDELVGVT